MEDESKPTENEGKKSSHSSRSSGRKSRNLREATQHLREEALRRYRLNHAGDDPPEDWEPPQDEQEDIIRCLSPPGEVDPELKRAQESGAFSNLGTPRPTPTKLHDSEVQEHQYPAKESLIEAEAKIKEESADDGNSRVSSVASDVLVLEAEIAETYTDLHTDTPMTSSVIPQSAQSHSLTLTSVNPDGSTVNVLKLDPPSRLNTQETERGSDYHTMLPDAMRGEGPAATEDQEGEQDPVDITNQEQNAEGPATDQEPAEQVPADTEPQSDNVVEEPTGGEQPSTGAEELPADAGQPPAAAKEAPAASEQKPSETDKMPADTEETPADTEQVPAEQAPADVEQSEKEAASVDQAQAETEAKSDDTEQTPAEAEKSLDETEKVPAATDESQEVTNGNPEQPVGDIEPKNQEAVESGSTETGVSEPSADLANKDQEQIDPDREQTADQEKTISDVIEKKDDGQKVLDDNEAAEGKKADGEEAEGENVGGEDDAAKNEETGDAVKGDDPNTRGDEASVYSDEVEKDDTPAIPDDFYYDYNDLVSKPRITEDSGLPTNMLELTHCFGYDCVRRGNLIVLDKNCVAYVSGNTVQILDLKTKEQKTIRSTGNGAIGAIGIHPSRQWIAIAEKGDAPDINVYEYPSLKLHRIMRGGTQQAYAYVCFSPDGKLLASVGGDPDYMLTLWDWKAERTVLRSKAFSQDVFKVSFSTELEGQLTSAGTGHIRFWKMAHTFTGLKLQGELGKFGKTEISDIEGYVELPDGKVLSGCENGNMLLWDGGLIKVEISRKGKKPCHHGPIQQIIMDEGELMSVGQDGCIRVWDFETVDTADSTDESGLFEMEPMNEIKIPDNCSLRSIVKSVDDEDEATIWYAQDANGGIWKLDLSFSHTSMAPERMMYYHAGCISGCSISPVSHLVATSGLDRTVRVHDYVRNITICDAILNSASTSILWAPKLVDTKGATILAGFEDGVVRSFILGKKSEKNRKGEHDSELVLSEVFKPHVKAVTSMAFDSTGETLATASDDGTVFFFNVSNKKYQPIGFVNIAGPATHISWSPASYEKTTLLVCCANGFAQEIDCPEPGNSDTSHTFQITGLAVKTHEFQSIKSQLRRDEELERKRLEEEVAKKKKDEERRMRIERGLASESDDEDEEEKDGKKEEDDWKPYIPTQPSAILYGYYSKEKPGTFWVSVDDFDAGYLYQCQFRDESELQKLPVEERYLPVHTLPVAGLPETPISYMRFSESHEQVLCGTQTGVIRVHPLTSPDLTETTNYWELSMHDNSQGSITSLDISFDGGYVVSVGQDGNFFVYSYMSQKDVDAEVLKAKIPSAIKLAQDQKLPDDIDDPHAYSIEDAKQKAEHDKMMKEAEERKQEVRRIIAQLRRQFKKLLERNHELPEHLRLHTIEFEMDPEIKQELARQTQHKIDTVKKELAWDSEKQQIALDKLKIRYKAIVECERIVVKSFNSSYEVSTYRAAKLSDDFYTLKAELEQRRESALSKARSELSRDPSLLNDESEEDAARKESSSAVDGQDDLAAKTATNLKGAMGQRIQKALLKVEDKKRKRAVRKAQWDELYDKKPDDNYEDPDDVAAIREAKENMGDYKLKTADDYVVPDHLRMNVEKAIMKLLIFKEMMHEQKYEFNKRVLALRDRKITIIDEVTQFISQLIQIKTKIGDENAKPIPVAPVMAPEEMPEKKMEYTRESLLAFKAEMEKQALLAKTGGEQGGFGGFGGGGGATAADKDKKVPAKKETQKPSAVPGDSAADENLDILLERRAMEPTPLELQIREAEMIRLVYQQDYLLRKIEDMMMIFDADLRCLYFDKLKLDVELKNADLRYITLFEEFLLLKEYEKHENTLGNKVSIKQQEKIDQQNRTLELNQKIELKKKDIEKLQEKEKGLHAMFVQSLGDNNKFADYLTKVFKKKIKRSKKKENAEGGSDDESEEESSDEEDWSESDDESGSEGGGYDLDICPPGCDQQLYHNTTQLREKRLDIEEVLTEEKKNRDQMIKDSENMTKKAKVILAALKAAEADLEAFQLEKQQKLNEFEIVVTLRLHQLLHHEHGRLPNDLSSCLVFNSRGLVKLSHRIKELEQEKAIQKRQQKDAKKKHVQLIKDRKLFDGKIAEMEAKCNQEMILKFGRIVNLEEIEQVTVNRQVEELKEKLRVNEIECSDDLKRWEEKIRKKKEKITELTRENTNRIETLNMMQTEKRDLQVQLDSKQQSLGGEFSGARKADIHERQRLIQLVQLQAQEVDALKEEIVMLSHKGGHILPPAQPPVPGPGDITTGSGMR